MGNSQSASITKEQLNYLKAKFGPEATEQSYHEALEIFKNLDVSTDGLLSKREFSTSLGMMGTDNSILANLLFDAIDTDRNDDIDFYEFLNFFLTITVGTKEEKLDFGFKLIDLDKNGAISKEEIFTFIKTLFSVLTSFELKAPELDGYVEKLSGIWDFNSEGKITFEKYREGCMQHEDFIKNLGALRTTSLVKPLKKTGKKVFLGQSKWDFMLSVMFGLQASVDKLGPPLERQLVESDYTDRDSLVLPTGKDRVVNMVSYAPQVFRKIRQNFNLSDQDFIASLGVSQVLGSFLMGDLGGLSELVSEGKSGSFFYFSSDLRFMVKTISTNEKRTLHKMLKNYASYMMGNKDTLLTRICGLYKLTIDDVESRFIVMANVFPPGILIHRRFDLKGSTIGRTVGDDLNKPGVILKDLDFLKTGFKIQVDHKYSERLIEQIEKDSGFLEKNDIIDYSLLIGIHERGRTTPRRLTELNRRRNRFSSLIFPEKKAEGDDVVRESQLKKEAQFAKGKPIVGGTFFQSDEGGMYVQSDLPEESRDIIYVGLIDILIEYETGKQAEHHLKSIVYDGSKISVCPPAEYGPRFRKFMREGISFPSQKEKEKEKEKEKHGKEEKKEEEESQAKEKEEEDEKKEKKEKEEEEEEGKEKEEEEEEEEKKEEEESQAKEKEEEEEKGKQIREKE